MIPSLSAHTGNISENDGDLKEFSETIIFNKKYSIAPEEIKKYAETGQVSDFSCFLLNEMAASRASFADYLDKNGMSSAGKLYDQLAELYESVCPSGDKKKCPMEISDLEQQAPDSL